MFNFANIFRSVKKSVSNVEAVSFLTVGKTNETSDVEIKRYIGVGKVNVLAVNPSKKEIKELMGYEPKDEPQYTGTMEIDGVTYKTARISFVVKTIAEECNGIEATAMLTFNLRKQYVVGSQSGKYQVMDKYGRDAWGTKEVITSHQPIMYSNGPANISKEYAPIYHGQKELINFFRKYLRISAPANYVNSAWVEKTGEDLKDAQLWFDNIDKAFEGNFDEFKEAYMLQPNNKIKVLFGIRTADTDNGTRTYQDVYAGMILGAGSTDYSKLQAEIEDRQHNGALSNRIYEFTDIHEYKVEATDFSNTSAQNNVDPFAAASTEANPWGNQ